MTPMIDSALIALLFCAVTAGTVPGDVVEALARRSVFPLQVSEVRSLFPAEEAGRVRDEPYEQPAGLTFARWDSVDGRCYVELAPSPADYDQIHRIQLGCSYDTRREAVAAIQDWLRAVDDRVASRVRLGPNGEHDSWHPRRARDGSKMSIEVRLSRDGERWAADLVFLNVYPPAYLQ